MFKDTFELSKSIVDRVLDKITEQDLPIETEIGIVKQGMVKVLFIYKDRKLLDQIISDCTNEEYDLIG